MPLVVPGYDGVVSALVPVLNGLPPRVVAIDGRDGVGKTTLGRYFAWHFDISLIETDHFLDCQKSPLATVYRPGGFRLVTSVRAQLLDRPRGMSPRLTRATSVASRK